MKKELRRLEQRDTELNNEIKEVRAELEQANEQLEQANGQLEQLNEQLEQAKEQNKELNKKQDGIEKLQKEQGIDIASLKEALDDLEDKKTVFIDQIAENYSEVKKAMKNINNEQFLEIMKNCCKDGKIDDKKMNRILGNFFPYDIVFKEDKA